jgi:hypothetical protein
MLGSLFFPPLAPLKDGMSCLIVFIYAPLPTLKGATPLTEWKAPEYERQFLFSKTGKNNIEDINSDIVQKLKNCYIEIITPVSILNL